MNTITLKQNQYGEAIIAIRIKPEAALSIKSRFEKDMIDWYTDGTVVFGKPEWWGGFSDYVRGPFHSITFAGESFTTTVSITFDFIRQNTHSHFIVGAKLRRYMEIGSRKNKVHEKKASGFDYSEAAQIASDIWTKFLNQKKRDGIEIANHRRIVNDVGPKMMEIAGKKERFEHSYEYSWALGVKIDAISYEAGEKCLTFGFNFSESMTAEEAVKLYKALFDLGLVWRS